MTQIEQINTDSMTEKYFHNELGFGFLENVYQRKKIRKNLV